jgi:hypothetical protein
MHDFGFHHTTTYEGLEVMEDETDNSCNSTQGPL